MAAIEARLHGPRLLPCSSDGSRRVRLPVQALLDTFAADLSFGLSSDRSSRRDPQPLPAAATALPGAPRDYSTRDASSHQPPRSASPVWHRADKVGSLK